MNRTGEIQRKTKETDIKLKLNLDGCGDGQILTGVGFFDHMLDLFKTHSRCDLDIVCKGDTQVDFHHTVEDVGIALGQAFKAALSDKRGIERFANAIIVMDESVVECAIDFSGRSSLVYDIESCGLIGSFDMELAEEFFQAFAQNAGCNIYLSKRAGKNKHHIIEGAFKAFARCVASAKKVSGDRIPSTKGVI